MRECDAERVGPAIRGMLFLERDRLAPTGHRGAERIAAGPRKPAIKRPVAGLDRVPGGGVQHESTVALGGTGEGYAYVACLYAQTKARAGVLTAPEAPQNVR